ncbi:cupredoxin family copper-binding protein (plasmid) [Rhizobium sp. CB3090]|uniref:cupredoxin domain-containing protein n=1 Tax=Rhizobium sp. CB3090 TaxID=3039156 RepID=UPI0024B1CA02|nr:cupredoxin family copper-binding protein [Rhizobium sp. CB3090]WFU12439.1 cupredoxin family copper-binding protein [Rhizobium sp. CB3090]
MSAMNRKHALAVVAGLLAMTVSTAAKPAEYQIAIANMKFGSPPATLHVGDVIVWRNDDIFRHTATARDGSFDIDLPAKSQGKMTIERAGTVKFYCRFHPMMTGELDVQP